MKKVTFINTYPGVKDVWPIEPMSKHIPSWVSLARQDYVAKKNTRQNHVFRCTGIAELYKAGYVIKAWHDIEVQADDTNISVRTPPSLQATHTVDVQQAEDVAKFIPKRPWSTKSILKINTPWHLISDVKFLMLPIPYSDDYTFESCPGVLDPSVSTEVNVQLYWNKTGNHIINSGTPLCYIVPLSEDKLDLEFRDATDKDKEWLQKRNYVNTSTFNLNIKAMKELFNKFWK